MGIAGSVRRFASLLRFSVTCTVGQFEPAEVVKRGAASVSLDAHGGQLQVSRVFHLTVHTGCDRMSLAM